jgi:hypothetical protein
VTILLDATRRWTCPNCTSELVTKTAVDKPVLHPCRGLKGLIAPMVPAGIRAKVEAVEREDYIGTERVRLQNGRPIMSVVTTRNEGQDTVVFAPTARSS